MKVSEVLSMKVFPFCLTLLHSERPKLYGYLAVLNAKGLRVLVDFAVIVVLLF